MVLRRMVRPAMAGALILLGGSGLHAQSGGLMPAALRALQPGQWQLTDSDNGAVKRLCLSNAAALLQLRHAGPTCAQTVEADGAESTTVRYSCTGRGYGRTTVSVETPRLAKVDTQGVIDGAPFQSEFEARRIGDCR
jgi:hypothetical protein